MIAVAGAAGSGTASAGCARVASDAVEIGRPLPAAPAEMAHPGTGQDGIAAAAGRPPQAAGEGSQDEPLVSGDDEAPPG